MALTDIINTLKADAAKEIDAIATARDTEIAEIKAAFVAHTERRTKEAASDSQRRADKVAERILAKARHHASFIETGAVQAELEAVFAALKEQLLNLSAAEYRMYLDKQWASLPTAVTDGTFLIATERAADTQAFLTEHGVAATAITPTTGLLGGFVLSTPTREYNHSFAGLLEHLASTKRVEISQQLAA